MSGAVDNDSALQGRYAIERELGRGGMGVVFLARDLRHDRPVAIKFLAADLAGAVGAARFEREIRTIARLSHPHILPLHDSGQTDGKLFYVMPYVDGESVRERLTREGPMRTGVALRIASQVADALGYAHARGIVHRDIKPENILLDRQGNAYVADFGIAHVLDAGASGSRMTAAAVRIGSPAYMSPEQIAGENELDSASDIYSLGCVLFEMLAGEPPFAASSAPAVMRRHLVDDAPSLRARRADIPASLDAIVAGMLAKAPEDRIASAERIAVSLEGERSRLTSEGTAPSLVAVRTRRGPLLVVGAGLAILATWIGWAYASADAPLEPSRYAILPARWIGPQPTTSASLDLSIQQAFRRWQGIDVVDPSMIDEFGYTGPAASRRLARRMAAAYYVRAAAAAQGTGSVHLTLALHDAVTGRAIRSVALPVSLGETTAHATRVAVDSLLFGRVTWGLAPDIDIGTRSYAARLAYGRAHVALAAWRLQDADSLFRTSVDADPDFARAQYWLAQTRNWAEVPVDFWRTAAQRAVADSAELEGREASLALGLAALAEGDFPAACARYDELARESGDFAAWFGAGECRRNDLLVVADPTSPSGYRYRASYHTAVAAYERAFLAAPMSARVLRPAAFERARRLFYTYIRFRPAHDATGAPFLAHAGIRGDTLVLDPYPWDRLPEPSLESQQGAMRLQRERFQRVARGWVAASPGSVDALLGLAVSMEMLADPAAIDTLRRARSLATDEVDYSELAIREVWLRVRFGAPSASELAAARALADSVISSDLPAPQASLAALHVLLGRPARAALHARRAGSDSDLGLPAAVLRPAAALRVFAAVGGPADSLADLERQVETGIRNAVPDDERARARAMYLEREAFLAWPGHRFGILAEPALESPTAAAYGHWIRGDAVAARRSLDRAERERAGMAPGELSIDIAYAEAVLRTELGDTLKALALLASALDNLQWVQPGVLEETSRAGALVRGMALRARLHASRDEARPARTWAAAASALWSAGEPSSRAVVTDLISILRDQS